MNLFSSTMGFETWKQKMCFVCIVVYGVAWSADKLFIGWKQVQTFSIRESFKQQGLFSACPAVVFHCNV